MKRKPVIAGNWKMNKTVAETKELIAQIRKLNVYKAAEVVVCVPFTDLASAVKACKGARIGVGAQNIAWADKGAFTGEISAEMLKEAGVKYAVIGHSERRQYFGETDAGVNKRTAQSLKHGIIPIVCVGETESERNDGVTDKVNESQIRGAFAGIAAEGARKTIVAYEPVWAIGTGRTATKEDADAAIGFIRRVLAKLYGKPVANRIRILYGGSMNAKNCDELMSMPEIDGGLIGGASLIAADFCRIIESAKSKF
ncbi:MAG: triose-phosphate isomerase [Firmicutes bacterium]|nr:triose-phosphate isomerase [Bacillota bacterium]